VQVIREIAAQHQHTGQAQQHAGEADQRKHALRPGARRSSPGVIGA
jgi:hypothetical protein